MAACQYDHDQRHSRKTDFLRPFGSLALGRLPISRFESHDLRIGQVLREAIW